MIDQKLITLTTLISEKSYTNTAKKLGLTQPAVSTHIKLLEQEFNINIFEKNNDSIKLTKEGKLLLEFANKIIDNYDCFKQMLEDKKNREVIIGLDNSYAKSYIYEVLTQFIFNAERAKIVNYLRIELHTPEELFYRLNNNEIDIIITNDKIENNSFYRKTIDDSLVLISSKTSKLSKIKEITMDTLKKYKIIIPSNKIYYREKINNYYKEHELTIRKQTQVLELDDDKVIIKLVKNGYACSILTPSSMLVNEINNLNIVNFKDLKIKNNINVYSKNDTKTFNDIFNYLKNKSDEFFNK